MSETKPWKTQSNIINFHHHHQFTKIIISWKSMLFYIIISLIFLLSYISPFSFPKSTVFDPFSYTSSISPVSSSSSLSSTNQEIIINNDDISPESKPSKIPTTCDYTNGEWINDKRGPLYNGSTCATIKDGQNCMTHERPDTDYLYWKWSPRQCNLSRFEPELFLRFLQGKHLAFIGDSLARNQLESLLCMLSSFSTPNLVYSNGDDKKFRRCHFNSHNVTISVYWSPFLVNGVEKSKDRDYNKINLDYIDEKWGLDLDSIDLVVLSVGHWYLLRAIYMENGKEVGCHGLENMNCTDIEFYDPFKKAINTSLKSIIQRKGAEGSGIDIVVTTFSPHHFEGDWDKLGSCSKTMPYNEGEKSIDGMNDVMRKIAVEEVKKVKGTSKIRVEALDVTKLSMLRPDGHPGPYMYYNPFRDGVKERVHNDCVHWCLPGPIDTWNEIMLDIIKRWDS